MISKNAIFKFRSAKKVLVSNDYIVLLTGTSAIILNQDFYVLHRITKLNYVYNGKISPNQKKLLLISNDNFFYIVDLEKNFSVKKVYCVGEYNDNLYGQGLWLYDSRHFFIVTHHPSNFISKIRCYDVNDLCVFNDYLLDNKFQIVTCCSSTDYKKYFFVGYNRKDNHTVYVIIYDGKTYIEIPLKEIDDVIMEIDYDEKSNIISVLGQDNIYFYYLDYAQNLIPLNLIPQNANASHNEIFKAVYSKDYPYIYFCITNNLYVADKTTHEIVFSKVFSEDIWDIVEVSKELLAISFVNSTHVFKRVTQGDGSSVFDEQCTGDGSECKTGCKTGDG